MRVLSRRVLREFWQSGHGDAEKPLRAWFAEVCLADWRRMADLKCRYPRASVIDNERVVFDIGGGKYRLVVKIWFPGRTVFVKFLGTHAEYDKLDVRKL
jgi:mRNA interferase HigB